MATSRNTLPAPILFPGDEPFWEAAREGREGGSPSLPAPPAG